MSATRAAADKLILSLNAGSSSLKVSLYRRSTSLSAVSLVLTSSVSNISSPPAHFSFAHGSSKISEDSNAIIDHASAFQHFLSTLKQQAFIDQNEIGQICHRVVHGGNLTDRVIINEETYHHIEHLSDLAPLHNGAALSVIKACLSALPSANSIAYFDTAFHRTIPAHISSYAIDQTIARERGLKKYGFHGLSYAFILRAASTYLQKPSPSLIVLHLGSGASACAIRHGRSLDTSMGLTPLSGLPGATRSGTVDPALIFHYTNSAGRMTHEASSAGRLHVTEAEEILNRGAGWQALAGTTDFGEITQRAEEGGAKERLAFEMFVDRVCGYVGEYYVKLGGEVDGLVFSGGVGERSRELRRVVGEKVKCLGFVGVDEDKNSAVGRTEGVVLDIGVGRGGKRLLVCRTDEQVEMGRACALDAAFWEDG